MNQLQSITVQQIAFTSSITLHHSWSALIKFFVNTPMPTTSILRMTYILIYALSHTYLHHHNSHLAPQPVQVKAHPVNYSCHHYMYTHTFSLFYHRHYPPTMVDSLLLSPLYALWNTTSLKGLLEFEHLHSSYWLPLTFTLSPQSIQERKDFLGMGW
ncbi:hypothetical protein K492DRAFT_16899 [Lichtheimia hyalospora FSU 10163]|nr:hypothetical protein K492DRAFT_16899 [Lichtheimia hyalospora FSU 10163]